MWCELQSAVLGVIVWNWVSVKCFTFTWSGVTLC